MNRHRFPKPIVGFMIALSLAFWAPSARAQSLFEIRYEPANPSEIESAGSAQINMVIDLVNSAPVAVDDGFQFDTMDNEFCTFVQPAPGVLINDSDPDGDPIQAFGSNLPPDLTLNLDGSFSFGPTDCSGTASFTYFVSDGYFSSNTATVDLVLNQIPRAAASPDGVPYVGTTNVPLQLDGSSSIDFDGTIVSYEWDFGDNTSGSGEMPTHTYTAAGVYTATLTVTDNLGAQDSDTATVEIFDPIPLSAASKASGQPTGTQHPRPIVRLPVSRSRQAPSLAAAGAYPMALVPPPPGALTTAGQIQDTRRVSGRSRNGSGSVPAGLRTTTAAVGYGNAPDGIPIFTANFSATSGTATAGSDFIAIPDGIFQWTLDESFPLQFSFDVILLDDDLAEGDETVQLTLSSPDPETTVLTPAGVLTIVDDEILGGAAFEQSEFEVGERARSAAITVLLNGDGPPNGGSIDYEARAGSATANQDFNPVSGTLDWPEGDTSPRTFTVTIRNDDLSEGDETIDLTLSNPVGIELGSPAQATLTIVDDDVLGTVQFRQSNFQASEGSEAATILVDLTGSMSGPASVQYTTAPGTAEAGIDFVPTSGTLNWEEGTAGTQTFTVEIVDDNLLEEDETVTLTLSNPSGIALGNPNPATLVILDNDKPTGVQIEGGDAQAGKVGGELDEALVIRVSNAQGVPVAGATVSWSVTEGEGELLDGAETITDGDGLTSNRLQLGTTLGDVQVLAEVAETRQSATFVLSAELRLEELNVGPAEQPVAGVLDDICNGDNQGGMQSTCDDLARLPDSDQEKALRELSPKKVAAQGDTALAMMRAQYGNLVTRLTALRRDRRRSLENLAFNLQGIQVPVESLADTFSSEQNGGYDIAIQDTPAESGGGASADESTAETTDDGDWLGRRLGFFMSGILAVGERPTVAVETGFDLETAGITLGVDYKFTEKVVWGGALGYMSADGDLQGSGGKMDSTGLSLATYFLYLPANSWYLEAIGSYGGIEFDSERVIDFPGRRQVAEASPEGNQTFLALGGGYDAEKGASTLTVFGRGSFIGVDIDPYQETNAPGMQLAIAAQSLESMLASAGIEYFYNGSMNWGVLTPSVRLMYNHEFKDDLRLITASFVDDPQSLSFAIPTAQPDRDFLTAGLSMTATLPRGISAFATYDNDFSRDDLSLYVITAGFRLELK
jgi:uncharacterized protein YhjY with autotransporter beta-barrel domain